MNAIEDFESLLKIIPDLSGGICTILPIKDVDEIFWPDRDIPDMWKVARSTCARCPVRDACRDFGDLAEEHINDKNSIVGFLAGETPIQRIRRRKLATKDY